MSELLSIDIKTLDDGVFQYCQTGLIHKFLEATWMEHCNGFPTPTKAEAPLGTDVNGSESKRDWSKSYASGIGIMLYLPLKKYHIYHLLFTSVTDLHITRSHHMRRM